MQHYKSIQQLIEDYKNLSYPGRIYIEGREKVNYSKSEFWILSSKEAKDQDIIETEYGSVPESLVEYKATSFLDVGTFQDIIDNKLEHNPTLSTKDFDVLINAIDYYLDNDDFQD
ncbi:MAG: hypothetical protein LBU73_09095 [Helicobacteraceae bacterium]|jgi:hypothetical protein|nr:hypothetical protein [Helicobacteraceae bacterium]